MKSRKRGGIQTAVAASADKHKLWLIIGIVLAVVLVLAIVFLSPARQALFGKAITSTIGTQPGTIGIIPPIDTRPVTTGIISGEECMNIQLLPVWVGGSGTSSQTDIRISTFYRRNVCTSAGCQFSGIDGSPSGADTTGTPQDPNNDVCTGTALNCPVVSKYLWAGSVYERGRQLLCEAQGCIFTSGGTDAATGDQCEPIPISIPIEICDNLIDDDGNNLIDCADPNCVGSGRCAETLIEICDNLIDDDSNSLIDCADPNCVGSGRCAETLCSDLSDNDGDGLIDCADPSCLGSAGNSQGDLCGLTEVSCTDGFDNDGDEDLDCVDRDCGEDAACVVACTAINPSGCETQESCINVGNYWHPGYPFWPSQCLGECYGVTTPIGNVCASANGAVCSNNDGCHSGYCNHVTAQCQDPPPADCTPDWECTGWDECGEVFEIAGTLFMRGRTCTDTNNCGTAVGRPPLTEFYNSLEECEAAATGRNSDVNNDGTTDSSDVTFLLYVLRAQSDAACGGSSGQTICDYSDDGLFACDSGVVQAMADETDRSHAGDTCDATTNGDVNNDGVVDSSDVTFLLYVLRAQSDATCGGSGQTICDYSDDGLFACDSGVVQAMADETDLSHAGDTCS